MEQPIIMNLTTEEANVLLQIIDVAVKAGGLQVAKAGVHFEQKIKEAAKQGQQALQEVNDSGE